ncbi:MAG: hypothetical protein ACTSRB_16655, partial [Candidatus Helarchaeota archaeon]
MKENETQDFFRVPIYMLLPAPFLFPLMPFVPPQAPTDGEVPLIALVDGAESTNSGAGPDLTATLHSQNETDVIQSISVIETTYNISAPTGSEWETLKTKVTFANIFAPNVTYIVEDQSPDSYESLDFGTYLTTGFTINHSCYLYNFSILLRMTNGDGPSGDIQIRFYNSTTDNKPDQIYQTDSTSWFHNYETGGTSLQYWWFNFSMSDFGVSGLLNTSQTNNNRFFITINLLGGGLTNPTGRWRSHDEALGPHKEPSYSGTPGSWTELANDFYVNFTYLPLSNNTPNAEEIGLKVNGSDVGSSNIWINYTDFNATVDETILFNITSDWKVNFTINHITSFERNYTIPTNFSIDTNTVEVNWTANVSSAVFGSTGQTNKTMTIVIPQ